jgi:hypothetical protein
MAAEHTDCRRCGGRPLVGMASPMGAGCYLCRPLSDSAAEAYKRARSWNHTPSTPDHDTEPTAAQVDRARAAEWGGVDR